MVLVFGGGGPASSTVTKSAQISSLNLRRTSESIIMLSIKSYLFTKNATFFKLRRSQDVTPAPVLSCRLHSEMVCNRNKMNSADRLYLSDYDAYDREPGARVCVFLDQIKMIV